jgi:cation diffusion facilitator CzcD-associated flavoprotein CzcO
METKVLVVGAGPYGLGIAQELWHRGVEAVVVGEPFELWFDHTPAGMVLRSDATTSAIYSPDGRFSFRRFLARRAAETGAAPRRERTRVELFRRYLAEVVERLPFAVERRRVEHLEQADGRLRARLAGGGAVSARAVVVATGLGPHRHVPECLRRLPADRVLHTWEARRVEAISGRRVLVLGSGQSAAEAVATLRGANEVVWAMRRRPLFFTEAIYLPKPIFKLLLALSPRFYDLPAGARRTLTRLFFRSTITPSLRQVYRDPRVAKLKAGAEELALAAEDGHLASPLAGRVDLVVAATGYRCTFAGLGLLAEPLREALREPGGVPRLDRAFQTAVPGLYLAGGIAEAAFGPAQRFIFGSWHAAPRIGRALAGV